MSKYSIYAIYSITCKPIEKRYIGQSNDPSRRQKEHFAELALNSHPNRHLQIAYNIYGKRAFAFDILENSIPLEKVNEREKYWIEFHDAYENGFNRSPGFSTTKTPLVNSTRKPLTIPPRDLNPLPLSLKELDEFEAVRIVDVRDFWCFVGKHFYHNDNGHIFLNRGRKSFCCLECYQYLKYDRWK